METSSPYQLSLLITERCNLSCSYCYCNKEFNNTIPLSTAIQAIDETMSNIGARPLRLLLMGGEPFMEFRLIKRIVAHCRNKYADRGIQIKAVTNGTLVHGELQQWLMKNKDIFHTSLSLDGSREVHNRNRCNSYDKIDIDFFLHTYGTDAEVSMVACPETMDSLAESVIYLHNLGFQVKCVLADDCNWNIDRDPDRWANQLSQLSSYYLSHPGTMPFNQLCESLYCIGGNATPEKCQPGDNSHCVDTQGERYSCHRCTPYFNNDTWHIPSGKASLSNCETLHNGCIHCPAEPICCSCPALVASLTENHSLARTMCALFKVTHVANAVLMARMFTECPMHIRLQQLDDSTKRDTIIGIQKIINFFQG